MFRLLKWPLTLALLSTQTPAESTSAPSKRFCLQHSTILDFLFTAEA